MLQTMKSRLVYLLLFAGVLGTAPTYAENWAQWRGPFFNGSTTATHLPTTWSKTEQVTWVAPLPGMAAATPVLWNDTIFVTSPEANGQLLLLCLNRGNGQLRWQKQLGSGNVIRGNNNMVSPSPATDGKIVIALFGTGDLAALDFAGNVLWARNLSKEFGKLAINWLYGSSPLLYNGRLYVQVLQHNPPHYPHALDDRPTRESFLLCVDPTTGKTIWRVIRSTEAPGECMESYATPIPFRSQSGEELLLAGGDCVTGHDAQTGVERWRCYGLNPHHIEWGRIVPSAVTCGEMIFACGPRREMFLAIRAGGQGLISQTHVAWQCTNNAPDVCTPLVLDGKLFALDGDKKFLARLDPQTGERRWSGTLPVDSILRASPTGADGKIYTISESGKIVVLEAGDHFKILNTITLGEAPCRASIAIADGQLFIRTAKNLYCIGERK